MNHTNSSAASGAGPCQMDPRVLSDAVGNRILMAMRCSPPCNRLGKCPSVPGWTDLSSHLFCFPPASFLRDSCSAQLIESLFSKVLFVLLDKHTLCFITTKENRDDFETKVLGGKVFLLMRPRLAEGF